MPLYSTVPYPKPLMKPHTCCPLTKFAPNHRRMTVSEKKYRAGTLFTSRQRGGKLLTGATLPPYRGL